MNWRCCDRCSNNPVSQIESTRLVTNWPVIYGVGLLLNIHKNTLFGKWPTLLGNRSPRQITRRPTGQQEIDDEVNSEAADVDAKVADGFTMTLSIADEGRR